MNNWLSVIKSKNKGYRALLFDAPVAPKRGLVTLDEWMAQAPQTLKTNLVKLVKTNGHDLGFLV